MNNVRRNSKPPSRKTMVFRAVVMATPAVVALLAFFGYSPLCDGMEDRYRAMLYMAVDNLVNEMPYKITDALGYGAFFDYIGFMQRRYQPDPSAPPGSAGYGGMSVIRTGLAGRTVIIYRPEGLAKGELLPALIYLHGGGWALKNPDWYDSIVFPIANCTRKITISVDYRHSPEHPFPAPVNDCLDVARHVLRHGKTLGVDVHRVGIAGDGTGGNLAAAVALRLTSERSSSSTPPLKYQALLWPALQAVDFQTPSYTELGDSVSVLGRRRIAGYWALYLGLEPWKIYDYIEVMVQNRHVTPQLLRHSKYTEYIDAHKLPVKFRKPRKVPKSIESKDDVTTPKDSDQKLSPKELQLFNRIKHHVTNPLLSPLMAPELGGLPSALILVSEFDVLRDDGLLYAHRLREAGVQVQVYIGRGFHGDFHTFSLFPTFLQSRTGRMSMQSLCSYMERRV
ncbi:hypothetical protein EGW08_017472 [Elysia chlorotica]|uniref:Alpha/beta hydrolase fold-3 domain-containing protein n=1 Tax=Elysia chlorotica TaxID=188477 RepID=A0A3S1B2V4_ELYCH|nr:hypothetical protein EGW08_017472 [Elysia chlorotica]